MEGERRECEVRGLVGAAEVAEEAHGESYLVPYGGILPVLHAEAVKLSLILPRLPEREIRFGI